MINVNFKQNRKQTNAKRNITVEIKDSFIIINNISKTTFKIKKDHADFYTNGHYPAGSDRNHLE